MWYCSNLNICVAVNKDVVPIKNLLNMAYRGETSKQGWTSEADLIEGDTRADEKTVQEVMQQTGSIFLIYKSNQQKIIGCINIQQLHSSINLGMFSVLPHLQGAGIGKQLLLAAEEFAQHININAIYMSVISLRTELIDWYNRCGYMDTGERKPFNEDGLTGNHLKKLEFMVLKKIKS